MKIVASQLLQSLIEQTQAHIHYVEQLKHIPIEKLNYKIADDSWSALACIEHLNRYGDFYLPEIQKQLAIHAQPTKPYFHSGILGNYFATSMLPKAKMRKMKTFKSMNPLHTKLNKDVLDKFLNQQAEFIHLLKVAQYKSIQDIKTSISISKWIKLRLGDTFRFVINHNTRHIEQIKNILSVTA
jgi:hypothetical protein